MVHAYTPGSQVKKYFRSKFKIDLASQKPAKSIFNGHYQ